MKRQCQWCATSKPNLTVEAKWLVLMSDGAATICGPCFEDPISQYGHTPWYSYCRIEILDDINIVSDD